MLRIKVVIPKTKMPILDYGVNEELDISVGTLVIVPYRHIEVMAVVIATDCEESSIKIKPIIKILDFKLDKNYLKFTQIASEYYLADLASFYKLILPVDIIELNEKPDSTKQFDLPKLNEQQQIAFEKILLLNNTTLLQGITGSGKTEIYFHLVAHFLKLGKQILLLLPEIGLSSQIISRFESRFGFKPDIWHSSISKKNKCTIMTKIMSKDSGVIIGTRSSLLLPYKNLGMVIIDEEQDSSYKQEDNTIYNARDLAVLRGKVFNHPVILGSATPSIESVNNVYLDKYNHVQINERFNAAGLPEVSTIDMRTEEKEKNEWLSPTLQKVIAEQLGEEQQVLLFLNRRGYSPIFLCSSCGCHATCKSCSSSLVFHKHLNILKCHHCNYQRNANSPCLECKASDDWMPCGPGVERILEETKNKFTNARIAVVTKDEMSTPNKIDKILQKIQQHEVDIIIGTQIITKGFHFPKLNVVGVIDADNNPLGSDLRGSEKLFQLLNQVSGRAGREDKKGQVFLQTYNPNNLLIEAVKEHDFKKFIDFELKQREQNELPPFNRTALISLSGKNDDKLVKIAREVASNFIFSKDIRLLGPSPALMHKLQDYYRYKILLIANKKCNLQLYIKKSLAKTLIPSSIRLKIDIDPYNLI